MPIRYPRGVRRQKKVGKRRAKTWRAWQLQPGTNSIKKESDFSGVEFFMQSMN